MNRSHDIEGEFHLLTSQESGRRNPVLSGYRPIHRLHENYLTSGYHEYSGVSQVAPGETAKVAVWFITPDVYPNSLWVGREIEVMEGSKVMGRLMVTKILNSVVCGSPETYSPIWVEPAGLSKQGRRSDG